MCIDVSRCSRHNSGRQTPKEVELGRRWKGRKRLTGRNGRRKGGRGKRRMERMDI